ncbi:MAG: WD40/YVTN/BNR-like repeat-containing protein [Gemmatimonadales bacterium]
MSKRRARSGALLWLAAAWPIAAQQPRVTTQHSGVRALLQSVSAVDEKTVWVGGAAGTVLRTIDGGDTWESRAIPGAERREFRGIEALNASEAWALSIGTGNQSRIYHTTDGGATWTEQFVNPDSTAFFDCITFFDARHGVVFSDASRGHTVILRTEDGGSHWAFLPASAVPAPLPGEGGFASSNSCIVHADRSHGWIAASEPGARIFGTTNAGSTWSVVAATTPFVHDSSAGITAISFRDAKHGVGVAARVDRAMAHDTSAAAVATTSDGGVTWTLRHRPPQPGSLSGVALVPGVSGATAVIAGYGGVFVTRNNGDSWMMLDPGGYWAVRAAGRRAWAVGTDGRITRIDF